ncbi:MAG: alpha-ribazole phosphatase [Rhodospirillales bacterium]|nr:alpha-ribazole phosphatase [Rhodospirillales bacterium]
MPVILMRHTRPAAANGICYGRLDLDVSDDFEKTADAALAKLPAIDRIVSSPAKRCRKLAEHIGRSRAVPMRIDEALAEMDFGEWEGRTWNEIGAERLDVWESDFQHYRDHGGESVAQFEKRVKSALAPYRTMDETVLIVCHAGVIRSALWPHPSDRGKWQRPIPFASCHHLEPV